MKTIKYKKLPEKITHKQHGFDYTLIKREGKIAWYEARYIRGNKLEGYMVAKIKNQPPSTLKGGHYYPARELLPSKSEFGKLGRFYLPTSRHIAEDRYNEWVAKREGK